MYLDRLTEQELHTWNNLAYWTENEKNLLQELWKTFDRDGQIPIEDPESRSIREMFKWLGSQPAFHWLAPYGQGRKKERRKEEEKEKEKKVSHFFFCLFLQCKNGLADTKTTAMLRMLNKTRRFSLGFKSCSRKKICLLIRIWITRIL